MPNLLDLAAMKAYAMGRRAKWKDYVDLYFLIKNHFSIDEIATRANVLFEDLFTKKLFIQQISYFKDISYEEPVIFCGESVDEETVKNFLIDKATEAF